ncbi:MULTISPECIES: hypothetical protein [Streptomyces]|uniref:Uncharacterized protein n=3 Tax=Streptomyces venezuelae TaxID=54571 RepID=F2RA96_STRVP|nr:hypothetical protein [Streptomyces venezuelae]APE22402.1 hypothetical protein vnz_16220 [Streptomyces venezuelae]QER99787.1 hypothetical protein DEJ43_16425 [Streptomyces venezuelae ATCC 10712]CCA56578.1 hypothetical protein SVEN_3292 [Streptomyces venezuelae ATCC 10712]
MSQHDGSQHERFEEELGAVLRRTGDGFAAGDRRELVAGGLQRGRRRLLRRRLAVTGGVLALAAVGVGGVYGGSLLSAGDAANASVAAPPKPLTNTTPASSTTPKAGLGEKGDHVPQIPVKDIAAVLKKNTPQGTWAFDSLDGNGQSVAGVFDDGHGKAAVTVGLYRAGAVEAGEDQVDCPDKVAVPYDSCTEQNLPNGSRLMILQGYEYPDKREETKNWRAVLLTKDGFLVDASEYNAAAEKGSPVTRENPPFSPAQLKTLVTSRDWRPLLVKLPRYTEPAVDPGTSGLPPEPSGPAMQATLRSLLPKGLKVVDKNQDSGYAHMVVDDGKGKSLVGVNVQPDMSDVADELFGSGDVTTLPDGRRVKLTQQPGEKGGAGVVWWSVDTITPEGFRVVVSAFNSGAQHEAATRPEPALTMAQLKAIALSLKWQNVPMR